jgi:hypothetical protein
MIFDLNKPSRKVAMAVPTIATIILTEITANLD